MAGFGDIPTRENGIDQLIEASWFNTIRTKLIEAFGSGAYILVQDLQLLNDDDELTVDSTAFKPFIPVAGNGGPVILNSLPFSLTHGFQNGKEIIIMGTSDADSVELVSNDTAEGLILNGQSVTLKAWHKITLMYYETGNRFIELERNF